MHLAVTIFYSEDQSKLSSILSEAFDFLGGESSVLPYVYLSYLDDSMKRVDEVKKLAGILPCRSIWDASGCRLSAVILLDIPQ
jgi:diphthine-ammonia ligase